MAFAIRPADDNLSTDLSGKAPTIQATLDTGYRLERSAIPYDEAELRRFLRGGLAAK